MKAIIQIVLVLLWGATAWGQTIFDPNDPQEPGMKYYLTLDVSPADAGTVSPAGRNQFTLGQSVQLTATPNTGYRFVGWKQGSSPVTEAATFNYTIPQLNSALTAYFVFEPGHPNEPNVVPLRHTLYLSSVPAGGGTFNVSSGTLYQEGQTVNLYAYPNTGYVFEGWKLGDVIVSTASPYNLTMGKVDMPLKAIFRYDPVNPNNPSSNSWTAATGELIVDDFTAGRLVDAVYTAVAGVYSKVLSIVVVGAMAPNDVGWINSNLTNCSYVDLSKATGLTTLPDYCFRYKNNLTTVLLPPQLTKIGGYAFSGCSQLTEIICHALIPPALGYNVFEGIASNAVVRVPEASVGRYLEAAQWNQLVILPLTGDLGGLTVSLPLLAAAGQYKNMTLEIVNVATAQKIRFTITDLLSYSFDALPIGAIYNVYVKTQNGVVLGELKHIQITGEETKAAFETLLEMKNVSLTVKTPALENVTAQTTIRWYDKLDNFVGQGDTLKGMLPGVILKYKVELNSALGAVYVQPPLLTDTVVAGDNNLEVILQPIAKVDINGVVKDQDGNVIANAVVSVTQLLNGKYSKSVIVQTDANGLFTANVYNDQTTVTVSCKNYISQTINRANFKEGTDLGIITLEAISGVTITTNFTYQASVPAGETPVVTEGYANYPNLSYTLYNKTKGTPISKFAVQYPSIVLLEPAAVGDVIQLTAASRSGEFKPVTTQVTIGADRKATATLAIVQWGSIKATYTSSANATNVGVLYNAQGQLIGQYTYAAHLVKSGDLADGNYTFVSMADSRFFNSVYNLSELTTAGLVANTDYILQQVTVSTGVVTVLTNASIPTLDETKLYYTGSNTSFTANRSSVVAGNYQTLRGQIDFKDAYKNAVSNVKLIVDIPDNCSFVKNSVLVGGSVATGYFLNGNQLIIPLTYYNSLVRFCIIPLRGGAYAPSAFVEFDLGGTPVREPVGAANFTMGGNTIRQPIGAANFTATDLSIQVPRITAQTRVTVLGTAAGGSTVKVYDNDVLVGQTTAWANGNWSLPFDLYQPGTYSKHAIYAEVHTKLGLDLISETKSLIYDVNAIEISNVTMINVAHPASSLNLCEYITPFDYLNPLIESPIYWYWPSYPTFTFKIDFTRNDTTIISNVILFVYTKNGRIYQLTTTYDANKGYWIAVGNFGASYLPINVGVYFKHKRAGEEEESDTVVLIPPKSPSADAISVMDPSGYVYEAVATNRLEGVTTTVYFKEEVEDMYGDKTEVVSLWDAEAYGQKNPLVTDVNGMYAWDVPEGTWQVKYEKTGYQTAYSAWLPVPPPQLDVNVSMVQNTQPTLVGVKGYEGAIDMEFDKYMQLESLDTFNITVTRNGDPVSGTIVGINEEKNPANASELFASKVRFVPAVAFATTDEVVLTVSRKVKSYAGIMMAKDVSQTVVIHYEAKTISVVPTVALAYNATRKITVTVSPKEASAGMKITATSASSSIATVTPEVTLDANGQAELEIKGELPGNTSLTIAVNGAELKAEVVVSVAMPSDDSGALSGDSNEDGKVNVYDVANVVDYIIAKNPSPFNFTASDVVEDSKINVYDVAGIVYIILHPTASPSPGMTRTLPDGGRKGTLLCVDGVLQLTTTVAVRAFDFAYTGEIRELKALDGFSLAYYEKDGQQRVIAYSMSKLIPIGTSDLFECMGNVTVSDLMFADSNGGAIEMNDQVTTSESDDSVKGPQVTVTDGVLRVESADVVRKLEIITMQGQIVVSESSTKVQVDQLPLSIYIVRVITSSGEYLFKEQLGK